MIVSFGKGKVGTSVKRLLDILGKQCVLMDDHDYDEQILCSADFIVVSPGIKQSHIIYKNYTGKVYSELNFLGKFILPEFGFKKDVTYIGITATNGKSTTTWITYNVLKGILPGKNIWITGNFEVSLSEVLSEIIEKKLLNQEHIFVIEASSFMLYKLENFVFDYSILLNIAVDHLDWHKDLEEYRDSKINILRNVKNYGICSKQIFDSLDDKVKSKLKIFDGSFDLSKTNFLGKHNQENLSSVYFLSKLYFAQKSMPWNQELFDNVLKNIDPLSHRLSLAFEKNGIKIYDDGICTSAHALDAALKSFEQKVVLIAGGYDKGEEYDWLKEIFEKKVGFAVLMGQTAFKFEKICKSLSIGFLIVNNLGDGLKLAYEKSKENGIDIILYSPGAASFDMFDNVYHRVEEFEKQLKKLNITEG